MFGENDGGGGGGFYAESSFSSPQASKKPDTKRAQNIFPVTARQVLSCSEDGLRIGNVDVYLVTLVGIVRSVENTSVKVTYVLEDDTGCIEGVHWIDGEDNNQSAQPVIVENSYCRMVGTIRTQSEKRFIMVFNIQQVIDMNEITSHRLEVALFSKKAEFVGSEGESTRETKPYQNSNGLANSLISTSINITGLSPIQLQVLKLIQLCPLESGIDINDIRAQIDDKSPHEINAAVEFLSGEGHIYTTIDDSHFRTTDSM